MGENAPSEASVRARVEVPTASEEVEEVLESATETAE